MHKHFWLIFLLFAGCTKSSVPAEQAKTALDVSIIKPEQKELELKIDKLIDNILEKPLDPIRPYRTESTFELMKIGKPCVKKLAPRLLSKNLFEREAVVLTLRGILQHEHEFINEKGFASPEAQQKFIKKWLELGNINADEEDENKKQESVKKWQEWAKE